MTESAQKEGLFEVPRPCLLKALLNASEKAANIARICRANPTLLSLLVEEKTGNEANSRFEHDFKTLADVLIQETIKHDVGTLFPEMRNSIKGEESPSFTNTLGQTVSICIGETEGETSRTLQSILNGNVEAAQALAKEVHREVISVLNGSQLPTDVNYGNLAIWIDPIDATAEYINGDTGGAKVSGIAANGLDCVTVLIGVYEKTSGIPVIGVVTQPFHHKVKNEYSSLTYWGVALPNFTDNNCIFHNRDHSQSIGVFSSSEREEILQYFRNVNYEVLFAAGAGHKALKVITHQVDVYFLSKGSTYRWDTCGPQAILRSLNGNIFDFKASCVKGTLVPLNYLETLDENGQIMKRNKGGVVAVRDINILKLFLKDLEEKKLI